MNKCLYMLIGPKGSGKTYIGTLVNEQTDINFLRVEAIWVSRKANESGWKKVEEAIENAFQSTGKVMIENLGAGEGFRSFLTSMEMKYQIRMIRVFADLDLCYHRVKNRNNKKHVPMSDEKLVEYNKIASKVEYSWSLQVENNGTLQDDFIVSAIQNL